MDLSVSIIKTLAYFSIFEYPLTEMEVWQFLWYDEADGRKIFNYQTHQVEFQSVRNNLSNLVKSGRIETKNGFYFLPGHRADYDTRQRRYVLSQNKYKKAIFYIKLLRLVPFIKMIAVCNSLSFANSRQTGDIDLFVITQANRMWLTRLLTVGWLKLLRQRPQINSKQDAIDITFFLSDDKLNIKDIRLEKDPYLYYWLAQLVPVYNPGDQFRKFLTANDWLKKRLPNFFPVLPHYRRRVEDGTAVKFIRTCLRLKLDWDWLEKKVKKFQLKKIPPEIKNLMNKTTAVVINDQMLKFHKNDRREEYSRKLAELISNDQRQDERNF